MIWFYERQGLVLLYEIRHLSYSDGQRRTERFEDSITLLKRSVEVQNQLMADGWRPQDH
jgi:hypothetical protein